MLSNLFGAFKIGLKVVDNFTDPDKREKAFHVAMQRNTKKAMDTAEDIIELIDEHLSELPERVQKKYKKLRRLFNEYD